MQTAARPRAYEQHAAQPTATSFAAATLGVARHGELAVNWHPSSSVGAGLGDEVGFGATHLADDFTATLLLRAAVLHALAREG